MASLYVADAKETKQRETGKQTWSEAADAASRLLAEERSAGTSLSWSYLGGKLPGIRFRTAGCLKVIQLLVSFAAIPLSFFVFQLLGFNMLAAITVALVSLNTFSKGLSIHGQFARDDAPVFMFLRTLAPCERLKITRWWTPSALYSQGILIAFIFLIPGLYVCPLWLYVLQFDQMVHTHERFFTGLYIVYPYCINLLEPMYLTMYFCSVGKGLIRAVHANEIFPGGVDNLQLRNDGKGQRIDIAAAYRNYEIMRQTCENFSASFRLFFFVVEFTLIIFMMVCTVAVVGEFQAEVQDGDAPLAKNLRITCMSCMWAGGMLIIVALASVSAGVTGAAKKVRHKAQVREI